MLGCILSSSICGILPGGHSSQSPVIVAAPFSIYTPLLPLSLHHTPSLPPTPSSLPCRARSRRRRRRRCSINIVAHFENKQIAASAGRKECLENLTILKGSTLHQVPSVGFMLMLYTHVYDSQPAVRNFFKIRFLFFVLYTACRTACYIYH